MHFSRGYTPGIERYRPSVTTGPTKRLEQMLTAIIGAVKALSQSPSASGQLASDRRLPFDPGPHFDDRLVDAAARLITNRWRPNPPPSWVTCVPSRRHQTLVPDFARRLASRLRLPFVECVRKVRDTEPQKTRANSFQQAQNVVGAFLVDEAMVRAQPVLLIDDMVDSRWTFTVLAVLLRKAGSGCVYPFALADSSSENSE